MNAPYRCSSAAYGSSSQVRATDDDPQLVLQAEPPGVARHRDERHHAGAAGDADGGHVALPDEPAADRSAQLEHVADLGDVVQEARHLAARQALDHQLEQRVVGVRGDRVGALRGVAVRRAQPDDVVLPGQVVDPVVDVEAAAAPAGPSACSSSMIVPVVQPPAGAAAHGSPW